MPREEPLRTIERIWRSGPSAIRIAQDAAANASAVVNTGTSVGE